MPMSLTLSSAGSDDMFCFVAVNSKTCNGNSTPREGQCIQMESQRRFRAVKRSWAIAEAAKSDPIGWSASRPCVNNFGLWYFAGRGGVRRPSPVDGHGPFATADAASSGRWPSEAPSPKAAASVDKISGIALTAVFDSKPESGFPLIMDALSGSKGIDGAKPAHSKSSC